MESQADCEHKFQKVGEDENYWYLLCSACSKAKQVKRPKIDENEEDDDKRLLFG